jgi:AAA+ superfamily predicted ATPase
MLIYFFQMSERDLGLEYIDQAKALFHRLAVLFSNLDGPSPMGQQVVNAYDKVLENAASIAKKVLESAGTNRVRTAEDAVAMAQLTIKQYKSQAGITLDAPHSTTASSDSIPALQPLLAELDSLIGLSQVKRDVAELTNYLRVQELRRAKGLKSPEISLHMVFHGNPGTGKTSVARLLSRIYKALGVVSKGHLVETDRSDLVAGYVGQTALKVKAVAEKALGGILFIDEAYALKRGDDGQDFGNEAIETLLKFMEDNRQNLVVIVAGYPVEMKRFLDANPGLQSRFNKSLSFPDYKPEELIDIFLRFCSESDYRISEAGRLRLSTCLKDAYQARDLKFGNARLVRNIFEGAIRQLANRVAQNQQADKALLELIEDVDIASATGITS